MAKGRPIISRRMKGRYRVRTWEVSSMRVLTFGADGDRVGRAYSGWPCCAMQLRYTANCAVISV
jgi:hypothetical protein